MSVFVCICRRQNGEEFLSFLHAARGLALLLFSRFIMMADTVGAASGTDVVVPRACDLRLNQLADQVGDIGSVLYVSVHLSRIDIL